MILNKLPKKELVNCKYNLTTSWWRRG